ncbi:MAG: short chain dehydrogenase [Roseiarcus sp.]
MSDAPRLRILVIGASGVLGRAVVAELGARHDIVSAGSKSGDVRLDIADPASIVAGLAAAGPLDAVACAAGAVNFAPLSAVAPAPIAQSAYGLGLVNKLMGQVNLTLAARDVLRDGGSITLISGVLADEPIVAGSSASMVNGALESFARAAAIELPRGLRINVVSPTVFEESMDGYGPFFRGFDPVPVLRAARAFSRSIEGRQTGQVYKVL